MYMYNSYVTPRVELGFVASLQNVAKESGSHEQELDFILYNITRSANHNLQKSLSLHSLYRTSLSSSAILDIFLYSTIHMINVLVALCITFWSRMYFSPSSQLKYFSQGCATSGILSLSSIYCW